MIKLKIKKEKSLFIILELMDPRAEYGKDKSIESITILFKRELGTKIAENDHKEFVFT